MKTSPFCPATVANPKAFVVETSQDIELPLTGADVKVISPPKQTEEALVMTAALAIGLTVIFTGSAKVIQLPLVTLALYQIVVDKFETVNDVPFITTLLFVVVVLTAADQVGEALEALTKFVLLCHCTIEPGILPLKISVILLVNAVEIPDKFSAVPTAHTLTFPPAINKAP